MLIQCTHSLSILYLFPERKSQTEDSRMGTFATWDQELFILVSPWSRHLMLCFSSVQSLSHVWLFVTPWIAACQASLSITNSWSLPTHVHRVGDTIQPSNPLSSPSPPTFNLIQHQGLFQWVSSSHQMAKVLEFQLQNIGPSNEHSGLISFRMDWLDLLAVQGTLKSLLQHHHSLDLAIFSLIESASFYLG